jgi:hypothetical protein
VSFSSVLNNGESAMAPIDPNALSGPHKNQLPLNLEVIGFPN